MRLPDRETSGTHRSPWLLVVTYLTTSFHLGSESVPESPPVKRLILKLVKKMICALFRHVVVAFTYRLDGDCRFISQR